MTCLQRQYAIQLKGGGIRVGCSDGSSEDLYATCVTGVSDVKGCGHTVSHPHLPKSILTANEGFIHQ